MCRRWATTVSICLLLLHRLADGVAAPNKANNGRYRRFSQDWWDDYFHSGLAGCQQREQAPHAFMWGGTDWVKNVDGLVLAWTHAIVNGGGGDIAVVLVEPESRAPPIVCQADGSRDRSEAAATAAAAADGGWSRFFAPMAHLCVFSSQQAWHEFMAAHGTEPSSGVSLGKADDDHSDAQHAWGQDPDIRGALEGTATDQVRAMGRVLHHLLSHVQPHLQGDVQSILHEPDNAFYSNENGKYVGMHVRKTEGRTYASLKVTETLDCFERAYKYLEDLDNLSTGYMTASEITGVCLISDDDTALAEAKNIVRRYFRMVKSENIVQASPARPVLSSGAGDDLDSCETSSPVGQGSVLVQGLAELQLMAKADVFVGVASEGFDRLVFLMRETLQFQRKTSLSMDRSTQFPGRYSRIRGGG